MNRFEVNTLSINVVTKYRSLHFDCEVRRLAIKRLNDDSKTIYSSFSIQRNTAGVSRGNIYKFM